MPCCSNTFSMVQDMTNVVWKMQRYHLVREFYNRPILPPPLILFSHVFFFIRYLARRSCKVCLPDKTKYSFSKLDRLCHILIRLLHTFYFILLITHSYIIKKVSLNVKLFKLKIVLIFCKIYLF